MAIDSTKGLKVNYPIVFLTGFVLLIASVLVFLFVIKGIYGNYEFSEILPTYHNLRIFWSDEDKTAAILYSKYTENTLPEGSTWLADNVDAWERFIKSSDLKYDIIDDQVIESGAHNKYQVLVLPGALSLSDRQVVQVKKFLEKGGSVFASGAIATLSNEGKWRGWDFFNKVFGLRFNKEIQPREDYKSHILRGNIPFTSGIPTGYALKIATWDKPIAADILEPRTMQISTWYDFITDEGLVRKELKHNAGIVAGTYGKGRFAWFGFELNSVLGNQEDYILFGQLFGNIIDYLAYRPIVFAKDWPSPYEAAAIITADLSENLKGLDPFLAQLERLKIPVSFFVDPEKASVNRSLLKALSYHGDVGASLVTSFPDDQLDSLGKLNDRNNQTRKIEAAKKLIEDLTNQPMTGLYPIGGFYNENTLLAMGDNYINYMIVDSVTDRSVPRVIFRNNIPMLHIPRTARDDRDIISVYKLEEKDFQIYTYEEDIDRLIFEGGLYLLNLHSDLQLKASNLSVIDSVVTYLRKKNIWLVSIDDLKEWWFKRGRIEMKYEIRSPRRLAMEVTNPSSLVINDFVLLVDLNKSVENIAITADIVNTRLPKFERINMSNTLNIIFDYILPGETVSFFIDYDNLDLI